jgi:hypothetical protein
VHVTALTRPSSPAPACPAISRRQHVAAQEKASAFVTELLATLQAKSLPVVAFGVLGDDVKDKAREVADVTIAALDALFATGFDAAQLCFAGEYNNYGGGGTQPFFVQVMGYLLVDDARPLTHALSKASAGAAAAANIRFEIYDYPAIFSVTPLLQLAALATMADRMWQAAAAGAGVRALLAAGADIGAKQQISCMGGGSPHVQQPYTGPPYDHTTLMVVSFTQSNMSQGTYTTGASGIDLLKALLAGGADANERDNEGVLIRESPRVSPEAKAVLDEAAAAAPAAPAAAAPASGWKCCASADADK